MMVKAYLTKIVAAVLFACMASAGVHAQAPAQKPAQESNNIRGEQDAAVTILVFSAFTCQYCGQARKMLDQVQAKYPGKVNIIFKHFPLGSDELSYLPHEAALAAADQGKFWEMHDALFAKQGDLNDPKKIEAIAAGLNLDMQRFNAALKQHTGIAKIKADIAEAKALKVKVTPTFYIDGFKLDGMQQASIFDLMVEHTLTPDPVAEKPTLQNIINASKQQPISPIMDERLKKSSVQ